MNHTFEPTEGFPEECAICCGKHGPDFGGDAEPEAPEMNEHDMLMDAYGLTGREF